MKKQKTKYKLKTLFCRRENLVRDIVILAIIIALLAVFAMNLSQSLLKQGEEKNGQAAKNPELEIPALDTTGWETYQNGWYGFEVKYPENWNKPLGKNAIRGSKWEYRYQFRKEEIEEKDLFSGFDVVIYNVNKVKELSNTDEFPSFKYKMNENETCRFITGQLTQGENFSADEILIPLLDSCHNPSFFYSLTKDEYIFNIVPVIKENQENRVNLKKDTIDNFPEFFSAASSFDLIDIKRPKPQPVAPKITAPMPVAAIRVNGRLVCAKKSDHPGKSKKGKGKHLDMECCLDPDEYPNPHCYYSPDKYGKYLK